ncbi:TlpA disulfide reductase family protein [Desulfocurvibacter africanus]|uniref:Alkyl hydroperoxide reductase/ Thiol specific antioxidant/ Mal allergen n=1 Tax=Desulfocurvibacter africanus subsp. africanus str. Walvis Bay TaxID=690850 RepID=F3Z0Q6_DESAF|nr:TlpA disulfide reductase family protein [Desulfocurvibacter africanus]EGJ49880.1 alkyl hydroperoxide reductase/ Thiol specific antioxidant/ Mal allergen [Desulfocurvibacter africanus subsp. africanus str. Walvis Bay]
MWKPARGILIPVMFLLFMSQPGLSRAVPAVGQEFPDLRMSPPSTAEDAAYLGVKPSQPFTLSDVGSDFLLLDVMSALCPHCQADAPHMNEVFAAIQEQGLGKQLKVLALGVNNTEFELTLYRNKYGVPFPLIMDEEMVAVTQAGVAGTPTYFLLDLRGRSPQVLHVVEGRMDSPKKFLSNIRAAAGLEKTK